MILSFGLVWIGVGLLVLGNPSRLRLFGARLHRTGLFRAMGAITLVGAAWPPCRELGVALGVLATLLAAMAAASAAVLWFHLRPRLYAATLPLSIAAGITALIFF